jgi:glycosyltransferase involved in cell wall biosynthesis
MLKAMVQAGHEVVGMAPGEDPDIARDLATLGVGYRAVPMGRTGLNPLQDLRTLLALRRAMKELRPDLLLSYTIKPVIYGSLAGAWAGVPRRHAMITGLGSALMGEGPARRAVAAVARQLYRFGMAGNQGVFFQNPDDRAYFERHGLVPATCRITMINGSGVDVGHYAPAPLPPGPVRFLMIARLTRDKGLLEYVEAARLLKARHPEARCRLLGAFDPNPTGVSREQMDAWQREGLVEHLGSTQDVRPFLADTHVFVLPSYGEGTPRSVLEAMSMGRAVITTLAPGCKETVLPERTGLLVPPKDASALAGAMGRFFEDPSLVPAMGAAGRALAEDKYDVDKVNKVIMKALEI